MRFLNYLLALTFTLLLFGCLPSNTIEDNTAIVEENTKPAAEKKMTLEDYLNIKSELNIPSPEFDPVKVESVASKYGYTYRQYKEFHDNIQNDIRMKDKLVESLR